jgi:branched-subunit amino acid aminotransferase/4-amino-4-deoxychorismate lyase
VWLDGERVAAVDATLPLSDEAILAGAGLFETIALRQGRTLDLEAHLARLVVGATVLGARAPGHDALRAAVAAAAEAERADCGWLKVVLTRSGRWIVFTGEMDPTEEGRPIRAVLLSGRRNLHDALVRIKSLSYAANLLGLEEARRRGVDEGLWLNTRGHLAEGCTSNLFVVRGRKLFTPAKNEGILPGVVRGLALDAARALRLVVHEGKLRPKRLFEADEAFVTSSLCGVRPLIGVDDRVVGDGRPGRITRALAERVAAIRRDG